MLRKVLFLSTVLLALAIAPPASAGKPIREIHPTQDDVVITDQCASPILVHVDGGEIIDTFIDDAGNPVKQIVTFPGNTVTFTNLDSGRSLTLVATGSFQLRTGPAGTLSAKVTGHGPFVPNPITGEPGIWYLTGHARATFDSQGNQTSAEIAGKLVDLCARLDS